MLDIFSFHFFPCLIIAYTMTILTEQKTMIKLSVFLFMYTFPFTFLAAHFPQIGQFFTIFILAGCILSVSTVCSQKLINSIFALTGYIMNVCINHIYELFFLTVLNIPHNALYSVYYNNIFCISYIIFSLFIYLPARYLIYSKLNLSLFTNNKHSSIILICFLTLCSLIFVINFSMLEFVGYTSKALALNAFLFLLYFFITIFVICFLYKTWNKEHELELRSIENQQLSDYIGQLEQYYEQMRIYNHDFKNILTSFDCYINEHDYQGLEEYFKTEILPFKKSLSFSNQQLLNLSHIQQKEVKSILYAKLSYALNHNLHVTICIPTSIHKIPFCATDIVRIIGNLLDNAIEASISSPQQEIGVNISENESVQTIEIKNSTLPLVLDISELAHQNISTKGDEHGLGLWTVHNLLGNYPNATLETRYQKPYFIQCLNIYKTTKGDKYHD